ncbi:MAG: hypothetical protein IJJ60_05225, partial [Clostridia bacterium]|nr:hypothetical protein [Clostridia bacterium]
GSQTNTGESKNTYSIDWGEDAKSSNYNTTLLYGDLTVTANMSEVKITAASHSQTYDGSDACPTDQPEWDNLPDGFYGIAGSSGSQIAVGSSDNVVTSFAIYKESDNSAVTENFGNIKLFNGTLTVSPKSLTVMLPEEDRTKEYDGNVFRKFVTVDGIWEETISGYITCTETAVGGPYGLTFEPDAASAETAKNYSISVTGTLTIVSSGDPPADATTDSPTTKSIKPPEPDPTDPPENDPVDPQENDLDDPQEYDPVDPQENNPDDPQENDPADPPEYDPEGGKGDDPETNGEGNPEGGGEDGPEGGDGTEPTPTNQITP